MLNINVFKNWLSKITRLLLNVLLTFVLVILSLSFKNPALPKNIAYFFVREAAKKDMDYKTKDWNVFTDKQFEIRYQDKDAGVVEIILNTIKNDFEAVNHKLNYFSHEQTIPIIIYPDGLSLCKSFGWDADQSAMGVYWAGVIRILSPLEWMDTSQPTDVMEDNFRKKGPMVHEYAHLVVDYRTKGNYTRWFTEGIAQLIEKEITGFQFKNVTDKDSWYSLKDMDRKFDELPDQAIAYSQSLLMVETLVKDYGYDGLNKILDHLGAGKTLNQAFQIVLEMDLNEFENSCRNSH